MVDKKEVIEALRWGADEWDKKAINLDHTHACKLCDIFNDTCEGCPLLIKNGLPYDDDCANWRRYIDAKRHSRAEIARKECSILASAMRWEAYKLENDKNQGGKQKCQ